MENLKTAVIFLDLSKAFDCVSHDQLLDKLSRYGVRGKPFDLFESYLRNRLQCVEVAYMKDGEMQNIRSDLKIVSDNVPQGSVMGPFLFNVYTNGLKKVIHDLGGQAIVYVDDTNIVITAKTQKELTELSMRILNGVYNYFASLKLALNVDKTVYMLFNNTEECTLSLKGTKIDHVKVTKFLGMEIEKNLKWYSHIDLLCSKLDKGIFVISQIRQSLDLAHCLKVYFAHIHSHLAYGTAI